MVGLDSAERMLRSLLQRWFWVGEHWGAWGEGKGWAGSRPSVPSADFF